MFILAAPVSREQRIPIGQAMRIARAISGLKLESIAHLMGDLSAQAVTQMETGEREAQLSRIFAMKADADGKRYVEAFLQECAALCEIEHTDRLVSELSRLFSLVKTRMARAELKTQNSEERNVA